MQETAPFQVTEDHPAVPAILDLVQQTFAYMEPRIDPPSSMYRLTVASIQEQCSEGEVWAIGSPPKACIFLTDKGDRLYLGKLAVSEAERGNGFARRLVDLAETRARAKKLKTLELNTRIELVENHETFQRLGFSKTADGRHDGFDRTTYIVMQKSIPG